MKPLPFLKKIRGDMAEVVDLKEFIKDNFKHFNAAVIVDAAEAWNEHIKKGGKMLLAMAGALSTSFSNKSLPISRRK